MLERLQLAILLIGLILGMAVAVQVWVRKRQKQVLGQQVPLAVPAILYFWGPNCTTCRTRQAPALAQLKAQLKDQVEIVKVDATVELAQVAAYQVLTLPTTVVLSQGRVVALNNGFTSASTLRAQLGLS